MPFLTLYAIQHDLIYFNTIKRNGIVNSFTTLYILNDLEIFAHYIENKLKFQFDIKQIVKGMNLAV